MKRLVIIGFLICGLTSLTYGKEEELTPAPFNEREETLRLLLNSVHEVGSPIVTDDYIVFTHNSNEHASVVLESEGYRIVHPLARKVRTGFDDEILESILILALPAPKAEVERYCLIVDGVWGPDPTCKERDYDPQLGLAVSLLHLNQKEEDDDDMQTAEGVRFVTRASPGLNIRLAGSWAGSDPYLYTMKETKPGFYSLVVRLPRGVYRYCFYNASERLINSAQEKVYSSDGRVFNVVRVE